MRYKPSSVTTFIALTIALPFLAYYGMKWYERERQLLPVYSEPLPDFTLVSQEGQPWNSRQWKGQVVVADFFFTHCGSICPKMSLNLKKVQEAFTGPALLRIASFTVDPERDSAARLKQYAGLLKADTRSWDFFTGAKKELYRLARNSFRVVATDGDGGPDDFIHSDQFVLLDKRSRIRGYYTGTDPEAITQLIHDIKKLQHEK